MKRVASRIAESGSCVLKFAVGSARKRRPPGFSTRKISDIRALRLVTTRRRRELMTASTVSTQAERDSTSPCWNLQFANASDEARRCAHVIRRRDRSSTRTGGHKIRAHIRPQGQTCFPKRLPREIKLVRSRQSGRGTNAHGKAHRARHSLRRDALYPFHARFSPDNMHHPYSALFLLKRVPLLHSPAYQS